MAELRVQGRTEPWRYKLESAYGDIAQAFARAMAGGDELAELRATRAAFDQWFGRPGRVHSYDARILAHIARGRWSSLARPTRDLTEEFVRGIGWYDGANFQWLAANVTYKDTGETIFPPYAIREFPGVKVAIVGMTLEATPTIVTASATIRSPIFL